MGAQVQQTPPTCISRHKPALSCSDGESDEGDEGSEGPEGDEGDEEEGSLCKACEALGLRWQDRQDKDWPQEDRLGEEQVWQGCEQEGLSQGEGEPVDQG